MPNNGPLFMIAVPSYNPVQYDDFPITRFESAMAIMKYCTIISWKIVLS